MTGVIIVLLLALLAVAQIAVGIYLVAGLGAALIFTGLATIGAAALIRKVA